MLERLGVLLRAVPTYLATAAVVVTVLTEELAKSLPSGWQDNAAQIGGAALAAIAAATAIVRRVTPVLPHQRGLLTPPTKEG